ncbi:MAG: DUF1684 domain-containing protein [Thermoplasmata archaeon]|nr:DUF1684 domain-containing protein [Thermoplasmata archaeon]
MPGPQEYIRSVEEERRQKDGFMAHHPESPFVDAAVAGFAGLRYFPIDPEYRVPAKLERRGRAAEAFLRTNRDGQMECRYVGDLRFRLGGEPLRLRVYFAGEQVGPRVFVPFRDATCGKESYGPGRYLTLELTPDDKYDLDFNLAFNPYCAYTDSYECGFPPAENDLPVPVPAGERAWSDARNPAGPSSAIAEMTERALDAKDPERKKPVSRTTPRLARTGARRTPAVKPRTSRARPVKKK